MYTANIAIVLCAIIGIVCCEAPNCSSRYITIDSPCGVGKKCNVLPLLYTKDLISAKSCIDEDSNIDTCLIRAPNCTDLTKYRTPDGSCNNLKHPTWGMSSTAVNRILPAYYRDGVSLSRQAKDGAQLPAPRNLSVSFFPDLDRPDTVSLVTMQWGQLIAHDIILSSQNRQIPNCCTAPRDTPDYDQYCLPILISKNDPYYSQFGQTCISMLRLLGVPTGKNCSTSPRQQVNIVTHMLDASMIYGSTKEVADSLREFVGGRLLETIISDGRAFLPPSRQNTCGNSSVCYRAGDVRVNQNTELTVLQILFLREHNRIARHLSDTHLNWSDEIIYQETKRIVNAEIQHITYNEWLPLIVGESNMDTYKLRSNQHGYTAYDDTIPVMILNDFSAGAYRSLHSNIQGRLIMFDYMRNPLRSVNLSDWMGLPSIIEDESNFDAFLLGLVTQPEQQMDIWYTKEVTNKLFHRLNNFPGSDLESFDINRGRDTGLPPYIYYVEACSGTKIRKFSDLQAVMNITNIRKLQMFYTNVADIDLFIGAHLEPNLPGARLGQTNMCIIVEQFYRLKHGDRFWYEIGDQNHSFTTGQLDEIKKATLSRLICDNSDSIRNVTPNSFYPPSKNNPIKPCDAIPQVSLCKWS